MKWSKPLYLIRWSKLFLCSYFDNSYLQKSCQNSTKNSHTYFTQIHQLLTFLSLLLFHPLYIYMYAYCFFLSHSRDKLETLCPFITKYLSRYFLRTRALSYITSVQLWKLVNLWLIRLLSDPNFNPQIPIIIHLASLAFCILPMGFPSSITYPGELSGFQTPARML